MPTALRNTLLSFRDLLVTAGPLIFTTIGVLALAYWWLQPNPPSKVVLATGAAGGAYAEFGKRYAELLKQQGITVELRATQGATQNLQLLRSPDSDVDVAFVQGGADPEHRPADDTSDPDAGLVSLGSLFYEPVWLFYRTASARRLLKQDELTNLAQLPGWRLNVGAPGSGVPNLVSRLTDANRVDFDSMILIRKEQGPAVKDLLAGRIDALVFASAPESAAVQQLLRTPGIALFDFTQADAYSRRFAFMSPVVLPRGVVDLASDLPPRDVHLVAPTATLVARESTHPALIQLFVQAAQTVHGGGGWFQRKGDFPSPKNTERPLAPEASRFYQNGPPLMQRYLPFWLANPIDRMWVVLASMIVILIPLSRIVPPLYQFRIRSRVFRWYGQLRTVENAIGQRPADELLKDLDGIEARVERVAVPLSYADELYALRGHIEMVRGKVQTMRAPATPQPVT
ncbi:TAXI family TRAP transporter solute-binding subunit [soil metagenome]